MRIIDKFEPPASLDLDHHEPFTGQPGWNSGLGRLVRPVIVQRGEVFFECNYSYYDKGRTKVRACVA
jgi:hypothetical protein